MDIWKYQVETKNGVLAMGNAPDKGSAAQNAVIAVGNDPFALPRMVEGQDTPKQPDTYGYTITVTPVTTDSEATATAV